MKKICKGCKKKLDYSAFSPNKNSKKDGLQTKCRDCRNALARERPSRATPPVKSGYTLRERMAMGL